MLDDKVKNYLISQGIEFKEERNDYSLTCFACGKKRKLYIKKDNGVFHCWSCQVKGRFSKFIKEYEKIPYSEAIKKAGERQRTLTKRQLIPNLGNSGLSSLSVEIKKEINIERFPKVDFSKEDEFSDYLDRRGITPEKSEEFDIRYSRGMKRIIFPAYFDGKCVGWQGRDISGLSRVKAFTCPVFDKSKFLYNYDKIKNAVKLVIVEGPIDCIKSSIYPVVALLGKTLSPLQKQLILNLKNLKEIVIGIDPSEIKAVKSMAYSLSTPLELFRVILPKHLKDLGDCNYLEASKYIYSAQKYSPNYLEGVLKWIVKISIF